MLKEYPFYSCGPDGSSNGRTARLHKRRVTLKTDWVEELGLSYCPVLRVITEYDPKTRTLYAEFWENGDEGVKCEVTSFKGTGLVRFIVDRAFKNHDIDLKKTNTQCSTQWDGESQRLMIYIPEDEVLYMENVKTPNEYAKPPEKKKTFVKRKITL